MGFFFEAEKIAFKRSTVKGTFDDLGLWPWNPKKILEACEKHCPVHSQSAFCKAVPALVDVINMQNELRKTRQDQILSSLRVAKLSPTKKVEEEESLEEEDVEYHEEDEDESQESESEDITNVPTEPPKKRRKIMKMRRIPCSAKGCKETRFWAKGWVSCPKCHKEFCPSHVSLLRHHKC